jgi:hypothetical protein
VCDCVHVCVYIDMFQALPHEIEQCSFLVSSHNSRVIGRLHFLFLSVLTKFPNGFAQSLFRVSTLW